MQTLPTGSDKLEVGSGTNKPSCLRAAMNKAAILGIMGATLAADANGQQQVAIATVPQQPGQGGPVTPGNGESTIEAPTAEMVIGILRDGKELIKKKFPTYNDAAFQQIVGQISLGTVPPGTLTTLALAYVEEPEKRDAIIAFSKVVNAPKPAPSLASPAGTKKLPPLNESPEEKRERLAEEKQNKYRQEILKEFNKEFIKKEGWNFNPKNSGDAIIKKEETGISIEFKERDKTKQNQNSFTAKVCQLVPGEYNLSIAAVGLNMTAMFQGPAEQVLGRQPLTTGDQKLIIPQGTLKVLFANENTPLLAKTLISKMTLSLPMENGKQVVVGNADGKR